MCNTSPLRCLVLITLIDKASPFLQRALTPQTLGTCRNHARFKATVVVCVYFSSPSVGWLFWSVLISQGIRAVRKPIVTRWSCLWPIWTLLVADMVYAVADVVCGRFRLWPIWSWPIWFVADIVVILPNSHQPQSRHRGIICASSILSYSQFWYSWTYFLSNLD